LPASRLLPLHDSPAVSISFSLLPQAVVSRAGKKCACGCHSHPEHVLARARRPYSCNGGYAARAARLQEGRHVRLVAAAERGGELQVEGEGGVRVARRDVRQVLVPVRARV